MPTATVEALALIRAALNHLHEEIEDPLLADLEDCNYFRKLYTPPIIEKKSPSVATPVKLPPPPIEAEIPKKSAPIEPKIEPKAPPNWNLSPQPMAEAESFEEIRWVWKKVAPTTLILEEIPSDEIAKKIATRWKTNNQTAPISILTFSEPPEQRALLEQIGKAIGVVFGSAKLVQAETIEHEKQWEAFLSVPHLKWVIACDYTLWQLTGLMQHYREMPGQGARFLGTVPLFLLPDLSLYLKDPLLKRSLWKALCQKLPSM